MNLIPAKFLSPCAIARWARAPIVEFCHFQGPFSRHGYEVATQEAEALANVRSQMPESQFHEAKAEAGFDFLPKSAI